MRLPKRSIERHLRFNPLSLALPTVALGASVAVSAGGFPQVSSAAEKAKKKYLAALEQAQQKYSDEAEQLFAQHLRDLEGVLETETKAGRLEVAVAIRDAIQRLRAEGPSGVCDIGWPGSSGSS